MVSFFVLFVRMWAFMSIGESLGYRVHSWSFKALSSRGRERERSTPDLWSLHESTRGFPMLPFANFEYLILGS